MKISINLLFQTLVIISSRILMALNIHTGVSAVSHNSMPYSILENEYTCCLGKYHVTILPTQKLAAFSVFNWPCTTEKNLTAF